MKRYKPSSDAIICGEHTEALFARSPREIEFVLMLWRGSLRNVPFSELSKGCAIYFEIKNERMALTAKLYANLLFSQTFVAKISKGSDCRNPLFPMGELSIAEDLSSGHIVFYFPKHFTSVYSAEMLDLLFASLEALNDKALDDVERLELVIAEGLLKETSK